MLWSILSSLWRGGPAPPARRRTSAPRFRPCVQQLENRSVPAIIPVSTLADAGPGSLRDAITQANAAPGQDDIVFGVGLNGRIDLTQALPALTDSASISAEYNTIIVSRSSAPGTPNFRIFEISQGVAATITGLGITNGTEANAGAWGGGVSNYGSLNLVHVDIHHNIGNLRGGGVYNEGMLDITDSSIWANAATEGGGIYNRGTTNVHLGSEISLNDASQNGGGIYNHSNSMLTVSEDTDIFWNQAASGGGIFNRGTSTMNNGDVYENTATGDGGGVYNAAGSTTLKSVNLLRNNATNGGGFYLPVGSLSLTTSTVSGNTATVRGAGGVYLQQTALTIVNSMIPDAIVQD